MKGHLLLVSYFFLTAWSQNTKGSCHIGLDFYMDVVDQSETKVTTSLFTILCQIMVQIAVSALYALYYKTYYP